MTDEVPLIDEPHDGTEVHLGLGASVLLALRTPGATGHRWQLLGEPGHVAVEDAAELPADLAAQLDDPAARLPGRSGRALFRVDGESAGAETLTFALRRPWEDEAAQTLKVRVVVG